MLCKALSVTGSTSTHVPKELTKRVQLYTWQLVSCIAHGCQAAIQKGRKGLLYLAYPVEERERPDPDADW
eukprot:8180436-Lingulodinium_polyedra.AAC.1